MTSAAQLYVWDDRFLWASRSFKGAMTRRYATNLVVAIAPRQPFLLQLPRARPCPCHAAICAAGARRCVDASGVPFLSLNLDPGSADAQKLERQVAGGRVLWVERAALAGCDAAMAGTLDGRLDGAQARALGDRLVEALCGPRAAAVALDPRVHEVAEQLRGALPHDLAVEPLARRVGLSPMRLMHLFSEQVGLPMSSFLLWAKMRRALVSIQSGQSLTEIAQACGFADSSHLTRTFQSFYAIRPSILADSSYVQVHLC